MIDPDRHVVLVGMMGAGKSTVGQALAGRLGRDYADTDELVEIGARCSVREFFRQHGETEFRNAEGVVLDAALRTFAPGVIGCGGGIVVTEGNRALLRNGRGVVVWLRARPDTLAERLRDVTDRPLLDGDPVGNLGRLAAAREAWYAAVADAVVDVDGLEVDEVVEAILS
jgi:shikimate kinase